MVRCTRNGAHTGLILLFIGKYLSLSYTLVSDIFDISMYFSFLEIKTTGTFKKQSTN